MDSEHSRQGPPPRPPIAVRPLEIGGDEKTPWRLWLSGAAWLISALLAVPTAAYAFGRHEEKSAALFADISTDLDARDLENARTITDAIPPAVMWTVLALAVLQVLFVVAVVDKQSIGARRVLTVLGVLGAVAIAAWYYVLFPEHDWPRESIVFAQFGFLVLAMIAMYGSGVTRWLRAG